MCHNTMAYDLDIREQAYAREQRDDTPSLIPEQVRPQWSDVHPNRSMITTL
jgi:hypothetical protein